MQLIFSLIQTAVRSDQFQYSCKFILKCVINLSDDTLSKNITKGNSLMELVHGKKINWVVQQTYNLLCEFNITKKIWFNIANAINFAILT